jgi:hypothetical protein
MIRNAIVSWRPPTNHAATASPMITHLRGSSLVQNSQRFIHVLSPSLSLSSLLPVCNATNSATLKPINATVRHLTAVNPPSRRNKSGGPKSDPGPAVVAAADEANEPLDPSSLPHINWFPGHMNKAMKELRPKIQSVQIVLEVRDARVGIS